MTTNALMRRLSVLGAFVASASVVFGCGKSDSSPGADSGAPSDGGGVHRGSGGKPATPDDGGGAASGSGGTSSTGGRATSGGTTGSGGRAGSGGATGGGGAGGKPGAGGNGTGGLPHVVGKCDALGAPGKWEEITPAEVSLDFGFKTPAGDNFGDHSFVIDPQNRAHIYLGTSAQGIYESTDCGATWKKVNTGRNGDKIDQGRQWTFVIDPVDPKILYTNAGYGNNNAWKSTNGGVDWDMFIDPDYAKALQFGGFVHSITMDPTDHQHLIVTPHFECEVGQGPGGLPHDKGCLLETTDAGTTWTIREGTPGSGEGAGQWMVDAKLWYWAEGFPGLWRTENGGETWEHVYTGGYATNGGFHLAGQAYYTGGVFNLLSSTDGKAWSAIPDSPGIDWLAGDATDLFGARGAYFARTSATNPKTWTELPKPPFPKPDNLQGWGIKWDPDHRLLYSIHSVNGFWRMVVQ